MNAEWYKIAQGLADILDLGTVSCLDLGEMDEDERGWSGAQVIRQNVRFTDGRSASMIFKYTDRKERCAMDLLTKQGRGYAPASYAQDLETDGPGWMAMEDLGKCQPFISDDPAWLGQVADALAAIHWDNMDRGEAMEWLPAGDEAYWQSVATQISVEHFEKKMEESRAFKKEFGKYLPELRELGARFAREMAALAGEKECMTLTHGDLQMRDGAHICGGSGRLRIIDFGFCRYAPFYIDLAGWFTSETLKLSYDALRARGFSLNYGDFRERAQAAFRYNGFIYLYPSLMDWQDGPTEKTGRRLLQSLEIILSGDFPERRINYSGALFRKLGNAHTCRQEGIHLDKAEPRMVKRNETDIFS